MILRTKNNRVTQTSPNSDYREEVEAKTQKACPHWVQTGTQEMWAAGEREREQGLNGIQKGILRFMPQNVPRGQEKHFIPSLLVYELD